jgi:hypothetical protein
MHRVLRILFVATLLLVSQLAHADEIAVFRNSIEQKLSRVGALVQRDQQSGRNSEQTVLVDVTADGSLWRTMGKNRIADQGVTAKLYRYIQMASPFPGVPKSLADYSAIRLAIIFVISEDKKPVISQVEIVGGFRYVEF